MQTIQELIVQYSDSKLADTYQVILQRLKEQETLWIACSPYTQNYYLDFEYDCPAAYIFTEKAFYDNFQDYLLQQLIQVSPIENSVSERMKMFGDIYRSGFETLVIDNGQQYLGMSLFDVIDKPDFSDIPEINRPVMNPALVRAANYFFQNLAVKRATKEMEAQLFKEIYQAKYLLAMDASKINMKQTNEATGEGVIQKDSMMSFPLITNAADKQFYPFFTDWTELRTFDKMQKYNGMIVSFDDMKTFIEKADGITINPFGTNIILTTEMLNDVESIATQPPKAVKIQEQVAVEGSKIMLGDPKEYPQKMVDELTKYFKTQKGIHAAYLKLMIKDNEQSYLMVVDFHGDRDTVFSGIANAGIPYAGGLYIDLIPYSDDFGKRAVENSQPFYNKKKFGIFG